jgi:aconitate hydratase 2/2-methylisocitrate dehydratase
LKAEGDWEVLQNILVLNLIMLKGVARTGYENILYLDVLDVICMGNQEKSGKGDTVMATSTRLSRKSC